VPLTVPIQTLKGTGPNVWLVTARAYVNPT
jgi:hypothetical protein